MRRTCPGLENRLRPKPQYITCPDCGGDLEIWTDEDEVDCLDCGTRVYRDLHSCLDWCEYADTCRQTIEDLREVPE